jgi:hypothetical protein
MDNIFTSLVFFLGRSYNSHPALMLIAFYVILGVVVPVGLNVCKTAYLRQPQASPTQVIKSTGSQDVNLNVNQGTVTQNNK